jgi:hypothetical protein
MTIRSLMAVVVGLCLCSCGSIERRGEVTISGRGVQQLTDKGDPLMETGVYAKKNVPPDYAAGYVKGRSDQIKNEFWSMQDAPPPPPKPANQEGKPIYYNIPIPEGTDTDGVKRAPREVTVPIVEFVTKGGRL